MFIKCQFPKDLYSNCDIRYIVEENGGEEKMDVLEVVEKILESGTSLEEIRHVKEEIEKIDEKIQKKREEIKKLEEKKAEIMQKLPEEVRALVFGKQRKRNGGGGGGRVRVRVNGQEFDSLKEAYYSIYPERRGKSYKFREELEKLAEKGEITLEYL